ncbi:3922_t:CDS:2, partial [Racocetra persica]
MTCQHIEQITKKINDFISKVGDYDSSIYKKLGSIVNKEDIGARIEVIGRREGSFFSGGHTDYQPIATYKTYDFPYIPDNYFLEFCNEIGTLLNDCDCQEIAVDKEKQNAVIESELEVSQSRATKKDNKLKVLRKTYEETE